MHTPDDIQYALATTRVLHEPDRRIDTFGDTRFEFQLLSELMDEVGRVRIRTGEMDAQRPRILRPDSHRDVEFDGFDPETRAKFENMVEKFRSEGRDMAFMQYGFRFRRGAVREEIVSEPIGAVRDRVLEDLRISGNPALAIIEGVDDAWEISILKFSMEMIMRSHQINTFDFKRRGLL